MSGRRAAPRTHAERYRKRRAIFISLIAGTVSFEHFFAPGHVESLLAATVPPS